MKKAKKNFNFLTESTLKKEYNQLTKTIRSEILAIQENKWLEFCKSIENTKKYSSDYWKKIKSIGQMNYEQKKENKIPEIHHDNKVYSTPVDKSNIFGSILKKTFSESSNSKFDQKHKLFIDDFVKKNKHQLFSTGDNDKSYDDYFSFEEMESAIKNLNLKSAPGIDKINNKHIYYLSTKGKQILLHLINLSWCKLEILDEWKTAKIKMLKKRTQTYTIQTTIDR